MEINEAVLSAITFLIVSVSAGIGWNLMGYTNVVMKALKSERPKFKFGKMKRSLFTGIFVGVAVFVYTQFTGTEPLVITTFQDYLIAVNGMFLTVAFIERVLLQRKNPLKKEEPNA